MARMSDSLPKRFPVGTKYVVESCGPVVLRYVELPDGNRVILAKRKALSCKAGIGRRSRGSTRSRKSSPEKPRQSGLGF
jgi:hypothetical protein